MWWDKPTVPRIEPSKPTVDLFFYQPRHSLHRASFAAITDTIPHYQPWTYLNDGCRQ